MEKVEKEQLQTAVSVMVADLFNEKEESEIRRKTEVALEKSATTISDLTSTLEEKATEMVELETKVSESEESIQSLKKELEAAREELETSKASLEAKEQELTDMNKTKVADERMAELESAGVARAEKDSQMEKIKEMSDEEFTSYQEELVYVRKAVEAELEKATKDLEAKKEEETKKAEEDAKKSEKDVKKEEEAKNAEELESEKEKKADTEQAKITPGQAAMAALNMEYTPDSNLMSKYAKLGEALAEKWKEESKE